MLHFRDRSRVANEWRVIPGVHDTAMKCTYFDRKVEFMSQKTRVMRHSE